MSWATSWELQGPAGLFLHNPSESIKVAIKRPAAGTRKEPGVYGKGQTAMPQAPTWHFIAWQVT